MTAGRRRRNPIIRVRAGNLKIHPTAQRRLVAAQLEKRMRDLDLDAIGVLHGVYMEGEGEQVFIIDGQHRLVALLRHGFDDWIVSVEIHPEADTAERAHELFLRLNARATVAPYDTFVNEVGAGNPIAVGALNTVEAAGLRVDRGGPAEGKVRCVSTIKTVYGQDERGPETLKATLEMLKAAWGTAGAAYEGKMVEGMALFVRTYDGVFDRPSLVRKLAKYPGGALGVLSDAAGLRRVRRTSFAKCVAETIVETYNWRRGEDHKLPPL